MLLNTPPLSKYFFDVFPLCISLISQDKVWSMPLHTFLVFILSIHFILNVFLTLKNLTFSIFAITEHSFDVYFFRSS